MPGQTRWLFTAITAGSLLCDVGAWRRTLESYWTAYPRAEAQDIYKLAHQGIMGSEHAVTDTAAVSGWMVRELAALTPLGESQTRARREPLFEPLPPDGHYLRVHLRPFIEADGDVSLLLRAFVATANGPRGDTAQFACAEQALRLMPSGDLVDQTLTVFAAQRQSGFSAVHHSAAFQAAYAPAYRVVEAGWQVGLTRPGAKPGR